MNLKNSSCPIFTLRPTLKKKIQVHLICKTELFWTLRIWTVLVWTLRIFFATCWRQLCVTNIYLKDPGLACRMFYHHFFLKCFKHVFKINSFEHMCKTSVFINDFFFSVKYNLCHCQPWVSGWIWNCFFIFKTARDILVLPLTLCNCPSPLL